jgi:hypothetical protein
MSCADGFQKVRKDGTLPSASVWHKSECKYDPHPPRWEYPAAAKVLKLSSQGKARRLRARWKIAKALRGEWVQLEQVKQRILVYYCSTLIRELDLGSQRSTAVERWLPQTEAE